MSFGLVSREQLFACVADQRRFAEEGRSFTLPQILIGRRIITADVYQQVVARIRQHLQGQAQANAPALPPDITASGRYHDVRQALGIPRAPSNLPQGASAEPVQAAKPVSWGAVAKPTQREVDEAARSWDDASSVIEAVDYERIALSQSEDIAPIVVTPQAVKQERRDTGIRRILGVDEAATEFDFGPYRILAEVAAGGMGVIYRARASDTGMVYALKALINVENANDKQLRRFIQEAQSAMRLDHEGIVRIHDIGVVETIPYFTMDLVSGKDLQYHLRAKSFPLDDLLVIVKKICRAVHFAHEHSVIHRDLKPANIIIREADQAPILTDFGLAKNLDSTFKLTAEGAMVGTPLFLSPEQVSGKGAEVDRRCDVYGMGVMLYQILTDRLPFLGRNPYEVYRKVLEEDATPPTQVNAQISPELEKICLMALAKDKEERYATADDMADDIDRYLAGESVKAQLPTPVAVAKARKKGKQKGGGSKSKGSGTSGRQASPGMMLGIVGLIVLIVLGVAAIVMILTSE